MAIFEIRETETVFGVVRDIVKIDDDGTKWLIPVDEANADYQQYLIDTDGGLPTPKQTEGE